MFSGIDQASSASRQRLAADTWTHFPPKTREEPAAPRASHFFARTSAPLVLGHPRESLFDVIAASLPGGSPASTTRCLATHCSLPFVLRTYACDEESRLAGE